MYDVVCLVVVVVFVLFLIQGCMSSICREINI